MLQDVTTGYIFQLLLIFARLGTAFAIFPALSSTNVPLQARLFIALSVSAVLMPIISPFLPQYSENAVFIAGVIVTEMLIGVIISLSSRFYFWSLHVVGQIVSMQSGLGAATLFDPNHRTQVAIFGNFLLYYAVLYIFVSDTHYLFIEAVVESYNRFPPNELLNIGDISQFVSHIINDSFIVAFKLSAPFLIVSIAILAGSGILSRLMPSFQVFFVITPAQILVIFCILYICVNLIISRVVEKIASSTVAF